MKTINKIITDCDCKYGAPMGRPNVGSLDKNKTIFDCFVPMSEPAYDKGGAYWGLNDKKRLRVSYHKDLSYIHFYWK
jgi:hypothetical protein